MGYEIPHAFSFLTLDLLY